MQEKKNILKLWTCRRLSYLHKPTIRQFIVIIIFC